MTMDIADSIPQMFRAQTEHRCQLQGLKKRQEPHIIKWTDEWRNFVDSSPMRLPGRVNPAIQIIIK